MIIPFILIISAILVGLTFFINKRISLFTGIASIVINVYYLFNYGLFISFYNINKIGSIGFTINQLNYPFIIAIIIVSLASIIFSYDYFKSRSVNSSLIYGLLSLAGVSLIYTALSVNLLELFIFLEISIFSVFFMILIYGKSDREKASSIFILWSQVGMALFLSSIILIGLRAGTMNIYKIDDVFNNFSVLPYAPLFFLLGILGMLIKGAQLGFNTWLPKTYKESPSPAIVINTLVTGMFIFVIIIYFYLFNSLSYLSPIFIAWALLTMIYGAVNTFAQKDFNKFLGYSSISQFGYLLLGASISFMLGLGSKVELPLGILASAIIYVSIALGKGILFTSIGSIEEKIDDKNLMLFKTSPAFTSFSFIGLLNVLGLPPTIGFLGEVLLILASADLVHLIGLWFIPILIGIFITMALSSAYGVMLFKDVYGGTKTTISIDKSLISSIIGALAIFSVIFSIYPEILTNAFSNFITFVGGNYILLPLIVLLPSIGAFIALITPKTFNQDIRGSISTASIGIAAGLAIYTLINILLVKHTFLSPVFSFTLLSYFSFSSSLMQAILSSFILIISFFISLYSIDYMKEDSVLRRYWGFFGFFVTSMLAVVLSDNIFLFLFGWEGTSLASFALISYYINDSSKNIVGSGRSFLGIKYLSTPYKSGLRALIFTRTADTGLIFGLGYLLFSTTFSQFDGISTLYPPAQSLFGSFSILVHSPYSLILLITLYLGGLAKSAVFPFTQWLVTAMTGPTPISALIHAATMVNLGAILTFITYPFLIYTKNITFFEIMIGLSIFTAVYTTFGALVSKEQKVILANSTADQISLAILSSSIGGLLSIYFHSPLYVYSGIAIGLFQIIAHGIYKASLFMNTGSVIHYTESRFIEEYSSLYKELRGVFILQLISALNLASIPPLIGFWAHSFIANLLTFNPALEAIYLCLEFAAALYIIRYLVKTFAWKSEFTVFTNNFNFKSGNFRLFAYTHKMETIPEIHKDKKIGKLMIISPSFLVAFTLAISPFMLVIMRFFSTQMLTVSKLLYFSDYDAIISAIGVIFASFLFSRQINLNIDPIIKFFDTGFFLYPVLDKIGIYGNNAFNWLFERVEDQYYTILNLKLPTSIKAFGTYAVPKIQSGILRNYVAYYSIGIVLISIILIILFFVK
ncbi:proton-conducting transporter membrane subunit [Acidianus manzaensis]|uniref:NADH:quinone oxidoreductase/Mrp antiporter transmembrane domain-containing protein n=1 Tax=Acidianus manzaensis TaxID=282676 RepID=A0A1W6JWR7_9CREN|nr:proton-conducting transporter membrane subunit [Acidianus manzaensis]ARM74664.1 hypothetical protein B6F84_00570 [Acidianus manzaensis]